MTEPRNGWLFAVRTTDHRGQTVTALFSTRQKAERHHAALVRRGKDAELWGTRAEWQALAGC